MVNCIHFCFDLIKMRGKEITVHYCAMNPVLQYYSTVLRSNLGTSSTKFHTLTPFLHHWNQALIVITILART